MSLRTYLDQYLDVAVNRELTMTAAEETAASFLGRALATAEVGGEFAHLYSRQILNTIGREIVLNGESLWQYRNGELVWKMNEPPGDGPMLNMMRFAILINWQTGRGMSAMQCAGRWKKLMQQMERGIEIESRATPYYATPVPGDKSFATALRDAFKKLLNRQPVRTDDPDDDDDDKTLKGATDTFVEGEMRSGITGYQPTGNYQQHRLGTDIPQHVQGMMMSAIDVAMWAMGVPKALYNPADANSMREAWRIYLSTTVDSVAKVIVDESARIGLGITLSFPELKSSDLAARARSFKDFVMAGMPMEQAAAVSGIMMEMQDA